MKAIRLKVNYRLWALSMQILLLISGAARVSALPVGLRVDSRVNPLGVDTAIPSLSWRSDDTQKNWTQSAFRIEVASNLSLLKANMPDVWDSGRVASNESVAIPYKGPTLMATKRYYWRVRTWDRAGKEQTSAELAWWEMGLIGNNSWKAKWIGYSDNTDAQALQRVRWLWLPGGDAHHVSGGQPVEFHYVLHLDAQPAAAVLHCLTGGTFTTLVNGNQTGHKQEWTAFDREDLRNQLHAGPGISGDNDIIVRTIAHEARTPDTTANGFAAVLDLRDEHGHNRQIVTDAAWTARPSSEASWQPAQVVGPLNDLQVNVGSDRRKIVPAPERISTGVSLLRTDFAVDGPIRSARLYITAMGSYRAFLNGKRIGETVLTPGFTDFRKRALYQTYDVTQLAKSGSNAFGVKLGGGWHGSPLLWSGVREFTGPDLLRAQIIVTLQDGTQKIIATDSSWKGSRSATDSAEIYGGESYDARLSETGWNTVQSASKLAWAPVKEGSVSNDTQISAQPDSSPHVSQTLKPVSVHLVDAAGVPAGTKLFDMGQNMVGVVRLRVHGVRGSTVRLRFAERLKPDGSVYTENLRNADATDEYTLRGGGLEEWTPMFTFHGFRYVQAEGLPAGAGRDSLLGEVENSLPDEPSTRFTSSSPLLNSMFELGLWGQRGNFVSIPTDCPQRDERLGWMGDAGVFWQTGSYNFDINAFTHKFMDDVTDGQDARGIFSNVSPNLLQVGPEVVGAPGWGDAGVLVPYATWMQYGDRSVIDKNWDAMERWIRFIEESNTAGLRSNDLGPNYADWLAPDPNTPKDLVATAYWALMTQQMKSMAIATGRAEAAKRYEQLYGKIRKAYRKAYVHEDGSVEGETQTAYVLTLYTGMDEKEESGVITGRLIADIEKHDNHLTTGFLGTPFLLSVLDTQNRSDVAYRLLLNKTYPSWGYMVKKGATTWWERWNGDTGDPGMNSYNHYAFGSVMAWVYRRVSGIDTDASGPGFHHMIIAPQVDPLLRHVRMEYTSVYGKVVTDLTRSADGGLKLSVSLPANTSATVQLPQGDHGTIKQDGALISSKKIEIGSGEAIFTVQ
ncbi:alpha-L-rhamnosidase [Granulicella tundricola]|uniref:alpha-L-rhamnosidase n=1 Tax=Granulicella tundricola (strain ATCC BAA-1859 / DSM 23138 / MP5ACTX9) TaxID=1198114 RepID=E8X6L6_GRATM|nr:alpha-L-rhamnosidase [Granulicella tundricola]ADW71166.1 alpha-L-rhamnosidase [Granulicella tundricola MP5ACTX9]